MRTSTGKVFGLFLLTLTLLVSAVAVASPVERWQREWPQTNFDKITVNPEEIQSGGPGKDGIPAIDHPKFIPIAEHTNIKGDEPVIGVIIGGEAKAYPLRILIWHEIVNDVVGGTPVAVTYCPLCNTSLVFDRRLDGQILDFGTTGKLRKSDLIMYDRQTQSWWQQYFGEAIIGKLSGKRLNVIASRLESFDQFKQRAPSGLVLVPNNPESRNYGANPYAGYDRSAFPFLFKGTVPKDISPMMRVIAINDVGFTLPLLKEKGQVAHDDIIISWVKGQRSALDTQRLDQGRDVGSILVTRNQGDVPYVVTFAFAFFAFNPDGTLYTLNGVTSGKK